MLKRLLSLIAAFLLAVPALAEDYASKEFPVFREALTEDRVALRFYDDHPNVPCLSLSGYYRLVLGHDMAVENLGDGRYEFTAPDGATAQMDVGAGTLSCADFPRFFNLMDAVCPGMDNQYLDAPAFARPDGLDYAVPAPVTLDLSAYRIPLHGEAEDVWLPLATLSDMFTNLAYLYTSFNGEKVYVNADNRFDPAWQRDPDYATPIYSRAMRDADVAAFAYDELCFAVDTFYGYPGRAPLNDLLAESGLDGALQTYSDASRRCRALLKSEKLGEYAVGSLLLSALLDDGGHSGLDFTALYRDDPAFADFAVDYYMAYENDPPDLSAHIRMREDAMQKKTMQQKRRKAYGNDHYVEKGDTAVIWFDSFMYDFDGWQAYYDGDGPRPEGDQMAHVIDGLERASRSPQVKNVVLDVSCNSGGSADMVAAIMSLIANRPEFTAENLLIGQNAVHRYRVDRNFDGAFDARDAEVRYDLRFGVLTSRLSFSCANLLPSLMRDCGMPVLGETSGGGTCAVAMHATPEGFVYQLSTGLARLVSAEGQPIDGGVPVDIPLTDGSDYSSFYDLDALSAAMNGFYGKPE